MLTARDLPDSQLLDDGRSWSPVTAARPQSCSIQVSHVLSDRFDGYRKRTSAVSPGSPTDASSSPAVPRSGRTLRGYWSKLLTGAEIYDPASGRFLSTASMNQPRGLCAAALLRDGRVLVSGGSGPQEA